MAATSWRRSPRPTNRRRRAIVPVNVADLGGYEHRAVPLGLMSTKEAIRQITIKPTDPIREAARVIQAQDIKFAIVCDPDGRLLGTVTDGDIRRSLLSDIGPSEPVEQIMNRQPQVTRRHDDPIKLRQQMREAVIRHLPEVDADGHVVDIFFLDGPERYEPLPNAAVLMAGGRGERLRPLTTDRPKPMLSIGGKPVLERSLEHLIDQGFRRFYFSHQLPRSRRRGALRRRLAVRRRTSPTCARPRRSARPERCRSSSRRRIRSW